VDECKPLARGGFRGGEGAPDERAGADSAHRGRGGGAAVVGNAVVGRCRLTLSKPVLKARLVSTLESKM
jgi:hypothetical protein